MTTTLNRLSTIDNPFNPFDNFKEWFMFDKDKGYNSCEYLARIANVTDDMSEPEENAEIERAIDEILDNDFLGIRIKVTKTIEDPDD